MSSPKVSVIVPAFNRSEYLKECLDSVSRQTFQDVEVIVVDDASSEPIKDVVDSVNWPAEIKPVYLRLDVNLGVGGAREAGRQLARGDFVGYLDSDDLWLPSFLEEQIANLEANPWAAVSYCGYLIMGERTRERFPDDYRDGPISKFLPEMFWGMNWGTNTIRIWRREATEQIGPWFDARRSQDVNYSIRAGCFDMKCVSIPKILACYREAHGEIQITQTRGAQGQVEIARSYLDAGDWLEKCDKLESRKSSISYAHLLFQNVVRLLLLGERDFSRMSLMRISRIAPFRCLIWWVAGGVRLAQTAFGPILAGRVARKVDRVVVARFASYHRRQSLI